MLTIYTQEFVNICGFIAKKLPAQICENYFYIQPAQLRSMLNKNKFDEADAKLHIWRNLGWLICEPGRLTKSITVDKRRKRVCMLNIAAYRQLRELLARKKDPAADTGEGETASGRP